jgi:hypothetical protein
MAMGGPSEQPEGPVKGLAPVIKGAFISLTWPIQGDNATDEEQMVSSDKVERRSPRRQTAVMDPPFVLPGPELTRTMDTSSRGRCSNPNQN